MGTYLVLLILVGLSSFTIGIQFKNDDEESTNFQPSQQNESPSVGFFPNSNEQVDNKRYSEISDIKYLDHEPSSNLQNHRIQQVNDNRKQLNFGGDPPTGPNQFYSSAPYQTTIIRKRPNLNRPYQYLQQSTYPTSDLANPFYHNYANQYNYPQHYSPAAISSSSSPVSTYPDFYQQYQPTRYPTQPSYTQQQPNYYTNNYANQFRYDRPSSSLYGNQQSASGLSGFLNNLRDTSGPFGRISSLGGQFNKALDDITTHDDLQCVPKVLCQMVQGSRRPSQTSSSIMNIPGLSMLITALPSSSPLLNFGRAALLGFSSTGNCDIAYPKCPRDEEQILFYLNNHRGGFFRFFNGGQSFGGDDNFIQQQSQIQLASEQQQQGLNLLALQTLADSLNGQNTAASGINLNQLFTNPSSVQRPSASHYNQGLHGDQSNSNNAGGFFSGLMKPVSDVVSNLLTGIIGTRFSKRSDDVHKIQKRIVNIKPIPLQHQHTHYQESQAVNQENHRNTLYDVDAPLKFSNSREREDHKNILKFPNEKYYQLQSQLANQESSSSSSSIASSSNSISPSDVVRILKELFPEYIGYLKSDNDHYNRQLLRALVNEKIGKILTGVQTQQQQRPIFNNNQSNRYQNSNPLYSSGSSNYYSNAGSNYNYNRGQQSTNDKSKLVYVTNAQGQIEYTLNELTGEKKRYL